MITLGTVGSLPLLGRVLVIGVWLKTQSLMRRPNGTEHFDVTATLFATTLFACDSSYCHNDCHPTDTLFVHTFLLFTGKFI